MLILTFISFTNDQRMKDFVQGSKTQIGKTYLKELNARGPTEFSNAGFIWNYLVNFSKASTI